MLKKASIDIGSNSILLLIMNTDTLEVIVEESRITSLGKDLDNTGLFDQESMCSSLEALCEYAKLCTQNDIELESVIVTATEAARVAKNSTDFFRQVKSLYGLNVLIITGEAEAYYTALGISKMSNIENDIVIVDIGGASTELIHVEANPFNIVKSISLPIGAVRTTDWITLEKEEIEFKRVFNEFDLKDYLGSELMCVAGTLTSLANIFTENCDYNSNAIENYKISKLSFLETLKTFLNKDLYEIEKEFPFLGKRIKSISGGAKCAQEVISKLEINNINFSTYGLRYGTLLSGAIDENFCV